jgi:hypothetical protein
MFALEDLLQYFDGQSLSLSQMMGRQILLPKLSISHCIPSGQLKSNSQTIFGTQMLVFGTQTLSLLH